MESEARIGTGAEVPRTRNARRRRAGAGIGRIPRRSLGKTTGCGCRSRRCSCSPAPAPGALPLYAAGIAAAADRSDMVGNGGGAETDVHRRPGPNSGGISRYWLPVRTRHTTPSNCSRKRSGCPGRDKAEETTKRAPSS